MFVPSSQLLDYYWSPSYTVSITPSGVSIKAMSEDIEPDLIGFGLVHATVVVATVFGDNSSTTIFCPVHETLSHRVMAAG